MLEMSLRDAFRPSNATQVLDTLLAITRALPRSSQSDDPSTLHACVSLAATVRKLLAMLIDQALSDEPEQEEQQSEVEYATEGDIDIYHVLFNQVPSMMLGCMDAMMQLDACNPQGVCDAAAPQLPALRTAPVNAPFCCSPKAYSNHQLTCVLLCSWVQMSRFRLQTEECEGSSVQGKTALWSLEFVRETKKRSNLCKVVEAVMEGNPLHAGNQ